MRSPSVRRAARVGASSTSRSRVLVDRPQQRGALGRLERARARRRTAAGPRARSTASRRPSPRRLDRSRTSTAAAAARRRAASSAAASGPADDQRQLRRGAEQPAISAHGLVAPGLLGRQRDGAAAARRSARRAARRARAGTRRAGRRPSPPVAERRRAVGVDEAHRAVRGAAARVLEAGEHVGGGDAVAREQPRDEPRARQPARDVVVQVGEQAAVARVSSGAAQRPSTAVSSASSPRPRRRRRGGASASVAPGRRGERERLVVGDVEPAKRVARVRVALPAACSTRARSRASKEGEADDRRGLSRRAHGATPSASTSSDSPGFETTSGPDIGAPRCWSVWATSWAISSPAGRARRLVLAGREEDVGAGRERAAETGAGERRGRRVGVDADVGRRVAESRPRTSRRGPVERAAAAARGGDVASTAGWAAPLARMPSPSCMREITWSKPWLPTLAARSAGVLCSSAAGAGAHGGRADLLEFGDVGFRDSRARA